MDPETLERLKKAGIDADEGTQRTGGNERVFIRVLKKFPLDTNFAAFNAALEAGDLEEAERCLHALKGVSANLSMTRLYPACQSADIELKAGRIPQNLDVVRSAYDEVVSAIATIES